MVVCSGPSGRKHADGQGNVVSDVEKIDEANRCLQIMGIRMETRPVICQDRSHGMDIADRSPVPYRRIADKNLNENPFQKKNRRSCNGK